VSVIFVVLPIALLLAGAAIAGFIWTVRSGQLDDLETPGLRPLIEEDDPGHGDRPPEPERE
jgi:cbb3-type cytochrome oxidase maturation protein